MLIEAIVVKKTPVREHDKLVTLYCRELGKVTAVAKGIMKASSIQALQLDEGNTIRCELVPAKSVPIITGAQAVRCYSGAKSSLVRWAAVQFFLQVVDVAMYEHQQDDALYACLTATLDELDAASDDQVLTVFRRHQDDLLHLLGYGRTHRDIVASLHCARTEMDDAYERIAQRQMGTINLFYELASLNFS